MVVLVNAIIAPKRKRKIFQYNLDVLFVLVLSNSRSEVDVHTWECWNIFKLSHL